MMAVTLTCFVCQSESAHGQQNSSDNGRRRKSKKANQYSNLDSATWKIFCSYFYPPPLVGLTTSSTLTSSSYIGQNFTNGEDEAASGPLPVFCPTCCQTISNLCNLHHQLELIQSQISKIVAQVSLTFVQTENQQNVGVNIKQDKKSRKSRNFLKRDTEKCDDNVIFSMRRCIRRRYQPLVLLSKSDNNNIPSQNNRGGAGSGMDDFDTFSPMSVPSTSNDALLDLDFFLSAPIKQEVDESILFTQNQSNLHDIDIENQKVNPILSNDSSQNISDNNNTNTLTPDLPIVIKSTTSQRQKKGERKSSKRKSTPKIVDSSGSEFEKDQISDNDIESNYEPDSEDYEPVKKRKTKVKSKAKSTTKTKTKTKGKIKDGTVARKAKRKDPHAPRGNYIKHQDSLKKPTKDPQVGENIYEYGGKWTYEKRLNESGVVQFYCMSCDKSRPKRHLLVRHFKQKHSDRTPGQRTQRIDDDHFIYDKIYSITRVTEPSGIFFQCGACGAQKKTIMQLKTHLREIHIEPFKWICDICGYGCASKSRLQFHQESRHEETKKYICEDCGRFFKTKREIKNHKESHRSEPFKCECGCVFVYSKGLRRHRQIHNHPAPPPVNANIPETYFVPHKCVKCNKEFVSDENFKRHQSICQGKVRNYCNWCGGHFVRLDVHKRRNCKKRFNQPDQPAGKIFPQDIDIDMEIDVDDDDEEINKTNDKEKTLEALIDSQIPANDVNREHAEENSKIIIQTEANQQFQDGQDHSSIL